MKKLILLLFLLPVLSFGQNRTLNQSGLYYRVMNGTTVLDSLMKMQGLPGSNTYPRFNSTLGAYQARTAAQIVADGGGAINPMTSVGDMIQGAAAGAPVRLASVATGNALISGGVTTANSWGKIGLTTHVSGTLPIANGGTGSATQNFIDISTAQTGLTGNKTFTGATWNFNSGSQISVNATTSGSQNATLTGGMVSVSAGTGGSYTRIQPYYISFLNSSTGGIGIMQPAAALSGTKTWELPNASGQIALTSDYGGISLGAIGSTPNANGASLSSGVLTLQPASGSFGGIVTTGVQTFAGGKVFTGDIVLKKTGTDPTYLYIQAPGPNIESGILFNEESDNYWRLYKTGSAKNFELFNQPLASAALTFASATNIATFGAAIVVPGQIKTTATGQTFLAQATSTASMRLQMISTGGNAIFAVESSAGGDQFTGTTAYSSVIGTASTRDFYLGTNSVQGLKMDGTTQAVTLTGALAGTSATFSGNISAANLSSGTYTPTVSALVNVSSTTPRLAQYTRVGNIVTVFGSTDITPTTGASGTSVTVTLPIASNLGTTYDANGTGTWAGFTGVTQAPFIDGQPASDTVRIQYTPPDNNNRTVFYSFSYTVI